MSSAVNFCGHLVVENVQKSPKIEKKNIDRKPVRPKDAKTERPKTETRKEGGRGLGRHGRAGGLR